MIYTSSHDAFKTNKYITYAISGNRGKDANYEGNCYPKLAPKLSFWKVWHDNIGIIPEKQNNEYYIRKYWEMVLSKLDVVKTYRELDNSVLLCYEKNIDFCHRHIVSAWFEIFLSVQVYEVKAHNSIIEFVEKPDYIKKYLYEIIKNIDLEKSDNIKILTKHK